MTKKFTQEQYKEIIKVWGEDVKISYSTATGSVVKLVNQYNINGIVGPKLMAYVALALANPETRELMYEKHVEEERKFVWTSKKVSEDGIRIRLYKSASIIKSVGISQDDDENAPDEFVTESELIEWGYNVDAFDKEEG